LKIKNQSVVIPLIFLLLSSVAVYDSISFSQKTTTVTETQVTSETSTEYVTHFQNIDATSTVFLKHEPDPVDIPTQSQTTTVTATIPTTRTVTVTQWMQALINQSNNYILVGGQNGTWFTESQFPRLFQISLVSNSSSKLNPVSGKGTVWSGMSNGSDWLISGWGTNNDRGAPNPYLFVYNGTSPINDSIEDTSEAEWRGGDIFAISSNGTSWFLSGMGSGALASYSTIPTNHLSAGLFNGKTFTDLSSGLPEQMDGILYADAYNGTEWLVGGGYLNSGVLFSFNGTSFVDLTGEIKSSIPQFQSVQSIAWNGQYWLVGGIGFLAKYDGSTFRDLTTNLTRSLSRQATTTGLFSVNSMAWNGSVWLMGGGEPVAINGHSSSAWLASYNSASFVDLTTMMPQYLEVSQNSSILSISSSSTQGYWIIGGYSNGNGILLEFQSGMADLSNLTGDMSYVIWVAAT
jgi:hypothetical protein